MHKTVGVHVFLVPPPRRRHFSPHITFYQQVREGTHGGPTAGGSEAWQVKRQMIFLIHLKIIDKFRHEALGCAMS
jgi:hypothetical protein